MILLGLTSNAGSKDFQMLKTSESGPLYEKVIKQAQKWGNPDNLMYVIGATHPHLFSEIRKLAEEYFFLVPGVGAQGGDFHSVVEYGRNDDLGLIINTSREIIYAGNGPDFQKDIRLKAQSVQLEMSKYF